MHDLLISWVESGTWRYSTIFMCLRSLLCIVVYIIICSLVLFVADYLVCIFKTLPTSNKNLKIQKREPETVNRRKKSNTMIKRKWRNNDLQSIVFSAVCYCTEYYRLKSKIEQQ